jgi:transcriptional regulator with XRE-family HTH domain
MKVSAEILRTQRMKKAMTQKELAAAAGVSYITISRMENGQSGPVKPPTLRKLSTALGLLPEELLDWDVEQGSESGKAAA